ncbi:MAG TPA: hypothetical protein VFI02_01725 [Armatimonadota bacterium]|nr:hypothetical protein [Armatimonadota bacterium]
MKPRTLVAARIYIALYAIQLLRHLPMLKMSLWRGHITALEVLVLVGMLIEVSILVGWIYLLKGRREAWTVLVSLLSLSAVGWVGMNAIPPRPPNGNPLGSMLYAFFAGYLGIPGIALLLLDRPSSWGGHRAEEPPTERPALVTKNRTRTAAYIFLALSALGLIQSLMQLVSKWYEPTPWLYPIPFAAVCIFWLFLLQARKWAWWALLVMNTGIAVFSLLTCGSDVGLALFMLMPGAFIPLAVLMTDPPSGWANPQSEIGDPRSALPD